MKKPPPPVRLVMESICIITNTKPERLPDPKDNTRRIISYWGPSIKLLNKSNFLAMLVNHNTDKFSPKIYEKIRSNYIEKRKKDFNPKRIRNASVACEGLCKWVIAICEYE